MWTKEKVYIFLSTPSARRATRCPLLPAQHENQFLSTPSARRATCWATSTRTPTRFLSTPSARRATTRSQRPRTGLQNFYPRPPRGGRRLPSGQKYFYLSISIHALREEGDKNTIADEERQRNFYPRPPRGGRPGALTANLTTAFDFYPRPPRGGRPMLFFSGSKHRKFLSTPSARRATEESAA